jgi:hypothetical protein
LAKARRELEKHRGTKLADEILWLVEGREEGDRARSREAEPRVAMTELELLVMPLLASRSIEHPGRTDIDWELPGLRGRECEPAEESDRRWSEPQRRDERVAAAPKR